MQAYDMAAAKAEIEVFMKKHPEVTAVDGIFFGMPGTTHGKRYPISYLSKLAEGVAIPRACLVLDVRGVCADAGGYGFSDGDPDALVHMIPGSLQTIPWGNGTVAQCMLTFCEDGDIKKPLMLDPRNVLAKIIDQLKSEYGLTPMVAFELEFYLVDKKRDEKGNIQLPISPLTGNPDTSSILGLGNIEAFGGCLSEIVSACTEQGIVTTPVSSEMGAGQFEINFDHHDNAMLAADQTMMFERAVRGVALKHGFAATFMAKPYLDQPGSGMHMHISLWNEQGKNAFASDCGTKANDKLLNAVGGMLAALPESMAIIAPNVNSYRRYRPGTAVAVSRSWGFDNRSVAMRIPAAPNAKAWRVENRLAGADANPYLMLAAALAGMMHGFKNKIDPGKPFEGNADKFDEAMPLKMHRALKLLKEGKILREYLGDYVDVYHTTREAELNDFEDHVSPREFDWYLRINN
jgi:glutamine synthetase